MLYLINFVDKTFVPRNFIYMALVYGILGLMHWAEIITMVYWSLRKRRLTFTSRSKFMRRKSSRHIRRHVRQFRSWMPVRMLNVVLEQLFSSKGFLGAESAFFSHILIVRELIQILCQLYQVYRQSALVARLWINNVAATLIVVNCISTPVLFHLIRGNDPYLRVMCLTVDAVLGAASNMAVPLVVFLPYIQQWDPTNPIGYGDELTYDDVWFINGVMENRQILSVTFWQLAFKAFPCFEIYTCMDGIKVLVQRSTQLHDVGLRAVIARRLRAFQRILPSHHSPNQHSRSSRSSSDSSDSQANEAKQSISPIATHLPTQRLRRRRDAIWRSESAWLGYKTHMVHHIFASIGVVVAIIHCFAIRTAFTKMPGCKLPMYPWFATKYGCAVLELNCYRHGLDGTAAAFGALLLQYDEPTMASLIFTHCPQFYMPQEIQRFPNLLGLEVCNAAIIEWGADASLTNPKHPTLAFIALVRIHFANGSLPQGLLTDFPHTCVDVEISISNLLTLPPDLDVRWPYVTELFIEHALFTEVPLVMGRMPSLLGVSFTNNSLHEIRDEVFNQSALFRMAFGWNRLKRLPDVMGDTSGIAQVIMDGSNLERLPAWITDDSNVAAHMEEFSAFNTPFCAQLNASGQQVAKLEGILSCDDKDPAKNQWGGFYPLELMARFRQP
ncbi:TPA: hypothetical protein N0F65_003058 [Lagenidium giganteum]|uniref:Leucine-rich repeat domain, L domain-like n=1 Tax=Lagenidium giganteum TaxID=4803 RepID=A0AAV2YGL5_9STRA|nr:TPA: hypothetical protein N0F65_003058 [Lagenidium giganteum]